VITQRASATAEAVFNARFTLSTCEPECVLYREDMVALLDHIGNLEFEVSRLKGTIQHEYPIAALYEAFNRRVD